MSSTNQNALAILASGNQYVDLAIVVGGEVVQLGKWLVGQFRAIKSADGTMTYEAVVAKDQAELATMLGEEHANLDAVNAELTRLKLPTVPDPDAPPPAQP